MAAMDTKPLISISVIGHVDSGKSTLTGRLATVLGDYDSRMQEKLAKVAAENKKDTFMLAYYTDTSKQEQKRGVTINTSLVKMATEKFRVNFLDCPGHADYIKNATSGCKQSDLSIVVVPADFQASCSAEGTLGTHLTLSAVLGSKNFIVCINKLDEVAEKSAGDAETIFDAACAAVYKLLKKLGVKREAVIFLPISALHNVGVFKGGEVYPFFKGAVPPTPKEGYEKIMSLEDAINYQDAPTRPVTLPLRLPISGIAHVPGHGAIFCGRVDYGTLKRGDLIKFLPTGFKADVKNIQAHKADVECGEAGMNIGFSINTKDKAQIDKVKNGFLVGPAADNDFNLAEFYVASCFSLKPKGKSGSEERGIRAGYTPVISCGSANIACKFVKILTTYTKDNQKVENPDFVPNGARFTVLLYPTKQVIFEAFNKFPTLGKFVCRDSGILVAAGQITECLTEEKAIATYGLNMNEVRGIKPAAGEGKKKGK
ncbi:elongation factor 1-alpha [Pancytospora philotis]|nr:elongation factor 1-alpha [Pancytospora philotis]